MTTVITTINSGDLITNSRTDVNNNFASLNTNKIETSYIDTDSTLSANSDSKIATQKAVKAYVDSGGNQNASETAKGIVQEATDAQVTAGTATGSTGAKLFVTPAKLATRFGSGLFKFGGTGADGALTLTNTTQTIDCANAAVVVKNYTSISITGTGKLAFSNPNTNGTIIILKSQGDVTLTSSQTPMIDASSMGSSTGNSASGLITETPGGGNGLCSGGVGTCNASAGGSGATKTKLSTNTLDSLGRYANFVNLQKISLFTCGTGGGTGGSGYNNGGAVGTGGKGGGLLYIECGGALNFTTTSGISVAGANGTNATAGTSAWNNGGGGGGGGGVAIILYNTLTSSSGTITVSGGTGGNSANSTTVQQGGCGGGGASFLNAGTGGAATGAGGTGGAGYSLVSANTEFA